MIQSKAMSAALSSLLSPDGRPMSWDVPPDGPTLAERFANPRVNKRDVLILARALSTMPSVAHVGACGDALEPLAHWLRSADHLTTLLDILDAVPVWRARVGATVGLALGGCDAISLFEL